MPYMANFRKTLPTTVLPTMGGLHLSEKGSLGVTLRYPDLQFYTLTPAGQAKGILPFVKKTPLLCGFDVLKRRINNHAEQKQI